MKTIESTFLDISGGQKVSPLLVILGETASGKTSLGLRIAKKYGGEIICADSRTIYEEADIGTAKPTAVEQEAVPHHLIDLIEPGKSFNVAKFKQLANQAIDNIYHRGKLPIMVGGSGLYIDSVIFDYQFGPKANPKLRKKLQELSLESLTILAKGIEGIDKINLKNRRYLIRFIEIGGVKNNVKKLRGNTLLIGLRKPRKELHDRIEERIGKMFESGLEEEVRNLAKRYGWSSLANIGIIYKVFYELHLGKLKNIQEVKEAIAREDRQLTKRQRTWFKRNTRIKWFGDSSKAEMYLDRQINYYNE
jgi:tRNA dimethylallyltransferase